ncbi:MAG: hypothetical protein HYT87_18470 [Nitrospirae bacterium]|nr:hypothetical protein [Nitrospirota bacterium]
MAKEVEIVIDGRQESILPDNFNTLDELVGDVVRRMVPKNRLVSKILVNGEDLTDQNQSRLAGTPAADVRSIEFRTEPLSEAVVGALDRAFDYLDRLREGIRVCVEKYRSGEDLSAHRLLAECLDGLVWFVSFSTNMRVALRLNYDDEYFQGETLTAKQNRLYEHIRELEKAQKNMDTVYMADLLEYEIEPILKDWMEVFPSLRERSTPPSASPTNGSGHA